MRNAFAASSPTLRRSLRTSLALTLIFVALSAQADRSPSGGGRVTTRDDVAANSETHSVEFLAQKIGDTQREIADLTMKADLILSYASNPEATIVALGKKLDREQIKVGLELQAARRETPVSEEKIEILTARYRQIFDELIQVTSKRRLPLWLIGTSKNDVEQIFHRKFTAIQDLHRLEAEYKKIVNTPVTPNCATLFR